MNQQIITAAGIELAFYEYHPEKGATIFFIHGNSTSSNTWRKQVTSNVLTGYRLICIDLPNHGGSGIIRQAEDCNVPAIARIMAAAVGQLITHEPFIICSVSLGTNIVAEMMAADLKMKGLIMAGPCIVGDGFGLDKMMYAGTDTTPLFADNVPHELLMQYIDAASRSTDLTDREAFLKDYFAVKGNFRSSLYATIVAGMYNDELELLQKANVPVCCIFGEEERVVNKDYLNGAPLHFWNNTINRIAGAGHLVNIDAPEAFNTLVAAFAKDIFTTNGS